MTPLGADGETWDVVVVGAGPAGSLAAWAAADSGARTLLLDRAEFPRYKTCGGGLIGLSLAALPPGVRPTVRDSITAATFTYQGRLGRTRRAPQPMIAMVLRDTFDDALAAAAVARGATFRPGTLVRAIGQHEDAVTLTTSAGPIMARAVVGADGSASRIGTHVGVRCDQTDLGIEVELSAGRLAEAWRGRVHLDWGPIPGSYGWVFPKGDSLTVGVIAEKGEPDRTRAYLRDFVAGLGLAELAVTRSSGHLTRCRAADSPVARGRVLVAGDAAGLLEPWTREGISFALRSGRIAGAAAAGLAAARDGTAVAAVGERYRAELESDLGAEMAAGKLCLSAFRERPLMFHAAVAASRPGWQIFCGISRGDTTIARELRGRRAGVVRRLTRT